MENEHNHDNEEQFIHLTDEEGEITEFEIIMSFDHEDMEYAVLYPVDGSTGDEALIFKVIENGEESIFENLEDDEFEIITKVYYSLMNENE